MNVQTMPAPESAPDLDLHRFAELAEAINDSPEVLKTYAAPEWAELSEDGQQWIVAIVRETWRLATATRS